MDKGHGRLETRTLVASTELTGYLDWPGVAQVFKLTRTRETATHRSLEEAYGLTSLSPSQASAERLLTLTRNHWAIENNLHRVLDVNYGEDRCRIRTGLAPQNFAWLRKAAQATTARLPGHSHIEKQRSVSAQPYAAVKCLRLLF